MKTINNPFTIDTHQLPLYRIADRRAEIDALANSVVDRKENILLLGRYGIGKTCVLRKLRERLSKTNGNSILLIEMDMVALSDNTIDFLSSTLQKLLEETWVNIFGRKYSELLLGIHGKKKMEEHFFRQMNAFMQLFRLIRPDGVLYTSQEENQFGSRVPITARKTEKYSTTATRNELRPSEFIHLAAELLDILAKKGIEQTVIFGDEANHINPNTEMELFKRNFEAFSERNVQFIFAAKKEIVDKVPKLEEAFPHIIELQGFQDKDVLSNMLSDYTNLKDASHKCIEFSEGAVSKLWQLTSGHPREIQRICRWCFDKSLETGEHEITGDHIFNACVSLYDFIPKIP